MLAYVARRLMIMIPTLLAISAISFAIIQLPPGDYLSTMIAEQQARGGVDMNRIVYLREQYGLDRSVPEQYLMWLGGVLQGDFGYSFEYNLPVTDVVGDRLFLDPIPHLPSPPRLIPSGGVVLPDLASTRRRTSPSARRDYRA